MEKSRVITIKQLQDRGACLQVIEELSGLLPFKVTVRRTGRLVTKDHEKWFENAEWVVSNLLNEENREKFNWQLEKAVEREGKLHGPKMDEEIRRNNILLTKLAARLYIAEAPDHE